MTFKHYQDRHAIYSECTGCAEIIPMTLKTSDSERKQAEQRHVCKGESR
jgi:hypothetical protein